MGYTDAHFFWKDFRRNPKNFLLTAVVVGILLLVFVYCGIYIEEERKYAQVTTESVLKEIIPRIILEKKISIRGNQWGDEGTKSEYDKLDNYVVLEISEYERLRDKYSQNPKDSRYFDKYIEVLKLAHENYVMFMRLDGDSMKRKKCLNRNQLEETVINPYYYFMDHYGRAYPRSFDSEMYDWLRTNPFSEKSCLNFR